jgi:uncharacterized membrane protein (GlpM family)
LTVVVPLVFKALAGACFVTLFALIAETISPKQLSGVFGAAPSVALASLVVTLVTAGTSTAEAATFGMIGGSIAMIGYWAVVARAVDDHGALVASVASWVVWLVIALAAYAVLR